MQRHSNQGEVGQEIYKMFFVTFLGSGIIRLLVSILLRALDAMKSMCYSRER